MRVTKFSGELVHFDKRKLEKSLQKSGANQLMVDQILSEIEKTLYEGIPTKKIYKLAFQLLKKLSNAHAARYNLRTAVQNLVLDFILRSSLLNYLNKKDFKRKPI